MQLATIKQKCVKYKLEPNFMVHESKVAAKVANKYRNRQGQQHRSSSDASKLRERLAGSNLS